MDAAYQERLMESRAKLFPDFFQKYDQDLDQDRSRSKKNKDLDQIKIDLDPDGLNFQIRGKFSIELTEDPLILLARQWKTSPATLTNALKRMGLDWVRQQIAYVSGRADVRAPGKYLSVILARNPY